MHFVYILQSEQNKSFYIGATSNLVKRVKMHNSSESYHTSKYVPWRLIYFEGYLSRKDAFSREKSLKRYAQGLRRIKERLRYSTLG